MICLTHIGTLSAVIAVDVPAGVRLVGRLSRTLTSGKVQLISWVMDLYWSPLKISVAENGRQRRREARLADVSMRGLRTADQVIVLGHCMARRVEAFARSAEVIGLVPDPCDPAKRALREELGISSDALCILYSGTASAAHPLSALLDAMALVAQESARCVTLLIAARGSEAERARLEPVAPNVRFISRVPEQQVSSLFATADVHVACLGADATGTCVPSKVYAALAAARACLYLGAPDGQAARDVIESGGGTVVNPSDSRAIADAILRYISDPHLARDQGLRGRAWIERERSTRMITAQWRRVLDATSRM